MTYSTQCRFGRNHAAQLIRETAQTQNIPKLVEAICKAAKDDGGYGVGFLFVCAESVSVNNMKTS